MEEDGITGQDLAEPAGYETAGAAEVNKPPLEKDFQGGPAVMFFLSTACSRPKGRHQVSVL